MRREVTVDILMNCSLVHSFNQIYVASTHSNKWLHAYNVLASYVAILHRRFTKFGIPVT